MKELTGKFKDVDLRITSDNKFIWTVNGKDIVKKFTLTKDKLYQQFRQIGYTCPYSRENKQDYISESLEHCHIPYMNFVYYYFVWENMRIPSLDEFFNAYIERYCIPVWDMDAYRFSSEYVNLPMFFTREEILGRLARGYNSYNRELQSLLEMKEHKDLKVDWSFRDDTVRGIDMGVTYKNQYFGIASYVNTSRSVEWKEEYKNTTRHDYSKITMIDLKAELQADSESCFDLNGIRLYKPSCIQKLYERITQAAS